MTARTGIALRSTVFSPDLIRRIATEADGSFTSVWFPAVSSSVDPFDLCALSLGATKHLDAGTGVIRLPEHDLTRLAKRADELNRASANRFFLGVGTGRLIGRAAVDQTRGARRTAPICQTEHLVRPRLLRSIGPQNGAGRVSSRRRSPPQLLFAAIRLDRHASRGS